MSDQFKWDDFDEVCHEEVAYQLEELSWDSAFETKFEENTQSSLFTVYWCANKETAVIDLHDNFVYGYDALKLDCIDDVIADLKNLKSALMSDERHKQVDQRDEEEVDAEVCHDFHICVHGEYYGSSKLCTKWSTDIDRRRADLFAHSTDLKSLHDEYFQYVRGDA